MVVRRIRTEEHGTWIAIVNTSLQSQSKVAITLPPGTVSDAVTGEELQLTGNQLTLDLYPCQLRTLRLQ